MAEAKKEEKEAIKTTLVVDT